MCLLIYTLIQWLGSSCNDICNAVRDKTTDFVQLFGLFFKILVFKKIFLKKKVFSFMSTFTTVVLWIFSHLFISYVNLKNNTIK